jgi:hypothetical protein
MKGRIYTVAVNLEYEVYEPRFIIEDKYIKQQTENIWKYPIFAHSETEAIEKYNTRYNWEEADIYEECHKFYYKNKKRSIVIHSTYNNYTFDELKKYMNSQDFLEYCRQELIGINEIIK